MSTSLSDSRISSAIPPARIRNKTFAINDFQNTCKPYNTYRAHKHTHTFVSKCSFIPIYIPPVDISCPPQRAALSNVPEYDKYPNTTILGLGSYFDSISGHIRGRSEEHYIKNDNNNDNETYLNVINNHSKCNICFPWNLKFISSKKFKCKFCNFGCNKKHYFDNHMLNHV